MAIAFVSGAFSTATTTASATKTVAITAVAGDTIIILGFSVGQAITGVSDTAGNVYGKLQSAVINTVAASCWGTAVGAVKTSGSITITVTFAASVRNTVCAMQYSGALGYGHTGTNTGTSTSPSLSITTQDNNNFVVVGLTDEGTATWASSVGNLRENQAGPGSTTPGGAGLDNTSATPASVTNTATLSVSKAWAAIGMELRTVKPSTFVGQNYPVCLRMG